jgi:hypothetical protein
MPSLIAFSLIPMIPLRGQIAEIWKGIKDPQQLASNIIDFRNAQPRPGVQDQAQQKPQPGEDEAEVLAYGTNNGPAGVAVTAEVPIGLHVTDDGLDCRTAAELAVDHSEDAALLARDEDAARVFGLWPR